MIAVFGPTAVGKSRIAVALAEELGGEIVSADSMQVYRGMAVLTDQPPESLRRRVPHHLVGTLDPAEEYSAARFAADAAAVVEDIRARGALPLLVGGTGLYLQAFLGGFSFAGRADPSTREKWERFVAEQGIAAALAELERLDPRAAGLVDARNPRRLARALEAAQSPGPSIAGERQRLWAPPSAAGRRAVVLGLVRDRRELYPAIDARVEAMVAGGALDEVRRLSWGRVSRTAAQGIGFSELSAYLEGKIDLDQARESMKRRSRRYAKRQLTWMRKMPDVVRIDLTGLTAAEAAARVMAALAEAAGYR